MQNQITLSQVLEGYLFHADACRLSPHTIADYTDTFRKLQTWLGDDPPIAAITADQVRAFFASLDHLSKKTILNYHTDLSALWNQIKADVLGRPVVTLTTEEVACLGAAILAGTAVGLYFSPEEAAQKLVVVQDRWEPDRANQPIYDHSYRMYVRLYDSLEELFALARRYHVTGQ